MIKSMTAFARTQAEDSWGSVTWELRSVNHRYLDVNFRIPNLFREIEPKLRTLVKQQLSRGKLEATLYWLPKQETTTTVNLNQPLLKGLLDAAKQVDNFTQTQTHIEAITLLNWPGVVMITDQLTPETARACLDLFEQALSLLNKGRQEEGEVLTQLLDARLTLIDKSVKAIETTYPATISKQRERLLARFEETKINLDPQRLEQEMIVFAQKCDIAEELDRLKAHMASTKAILNKGGVIGRRLDFLMQELNREANTLAAKSVDSGITEQAVDIKVSIEQMREQIQNIE